MRFVIISVIALSLTGCSTIKQAQFNSARQDASAAEAKCHVTVMGVDDAECLAKYPLDESQTSNPYYVNMQRADCMGKAWHQGATEQPHSDIAKNMYAYADLLVNSAQDVASHADTAANRDAMLGNYQMDKFQYNPLLARAHMQCHTAAMASTMSSYQFPGVIMSYNQKMTAMADEVAKGNATLEQAKAFSQLAWSQMLANEGQANAQASAESSAYWQRVGNGLRALGNAQNAQQANPYISAPAAPAMPIQTNCRYSGSFGGSMQCTTQ